MTQRTPCSSACACPRGRGCLLGHEENGSLGKDVVGNFDSLEQFVMVNLMGLSPSSVLYIVCFLPCLPRKTTPSEVRLTYRHKTGLDGPSGKRLVRRDSFQEFDIGRGT